MLSWKRLSCIVLVLCLLLAAFPAFPASGGDIAEGPVTIEADSISYNEDEAAVHASGKVVITFTQGFLKADAVTLYHETNLALAEGNVLIHSDQDVIEGEKVVFNISSKTGVVDNGKLFIAQNHLYAKGEKIEKKGESTYRLEKAKVTTCDGETPDWSLAASELNVTVDGYGTMKHGRFLTRDIPLLYVPYMFFPAKTTRQSGFLFPMFSLSSERNGLDVELPFFWAISENTDATLYQRYLEKRGFKEGVEFRYFLNPTSFGTLYADYINDRKRITETIGSMSRDWQEDQKRWSFYLNHETTFASGFNIRSDIYRVSDPWYFRDFSSSNYYLGHYSQTGDNKFQRIPFLADESLGSLTSTVRLTKDWSVYNLSAVASHTDDFLSPTNDGTLQVYPSVNLTGVQQPLFGSPLQLDFGAAYVHFYRREGQKGHLWELNPTVSLPTRLGPYLRATPWARFHGTIWDRTDSETDTEEKDGSRKVFPVGGTLSTEISRVFTLGSGIGGVEKIRHSIRPEIFYTYIPEVRQENLPNFVGGIAAQNSMTYALTNTIISRTRGADGKAKYQQLLRLLLAQTYDIRESRRELTDPDTDKRRPFGDVALELDLTPIQYFSFAARNIYSTNSGDWTQSNYDLTLLDNRGDFISAGYRYTKDSLQEINLYLQASLTSSIDAVYILRRNLLDKKTIESTYGVKYRRQCWLFQVNVTSGEYDRTVMAYVSLLGLGGGGVNMTLQRGGEGAGGAAF
ncbi:MAG: LPS assembly protein LptD [Deltaproteobacteria bacterium]|nr:LPS assembly protein LptD [Deltaproteobacteria bacterium]